MNKIPLTHAMDIFAESFEKVNLHAKEIKKSEFEECKFISCDFSESFFNSCTFVDCYFENCNLSLVKLTNTKISNTEFVSCKMILIDWTMCDYKSLLTREPIKFTDSILDENNFFGLNLDDIEIKECRAHEVDFSSASLKRANFIATDFKGAIFNNTHLEKANFKDAQNCSIDIRKNFLEGAIFSRFEALYLLENMGITLVD